MTRPIILTTGANLDNLDVPGSYVVTNPVNLPAGTYLVEIIKGTLPEGNRSFTLQRFADIATGIVTQRTTAGNTTFSTLASIGTEAGDAITDHGALTGLDDDDHAQYLNQTRGDARYALGTHVHEGVYDPVGTAATAVSAHEAAVDPHDQYYDQARGDARWIQSLNPATGDRVGVNATADDTNRLSVASLESLFNHTGHGHRATINKAAAGETASITFKTGFSGRAEVGTTGDDDFHFKVSPNGSTWHEAIVIDKDTGEVSFPKGGGGINPNLIINGDFQINQRAFAGGALSAGVYGFDRWKASTGGANLAVSGYVVTLASGEIEQIIEPGVWGYASFAALQATASVEVAPSQDITVTVGSQSGTIPAGQRSVTLTLGAGDTGNLPLKIKRATAGSVTFGRVKLEVGAVVTEWQARPLPQELRLAQRYFEKSYAPPVALGTAWAEGRAVLFLFGSLTGLWTPGTIVQFKTTKRIAPTMTVYNPATGSVGTALDITNAANVTPSFDLTEDSFLWFATTSAAAAGGYNIQFHWTASAEL